MRREHLGRARTVRPGAAPSSTPSPESPNRYAPPRHRCCSPPRPPLAPPSASAAASVNPRPHIPSSSSPSLNTGLHCYRVSISPCLIVHFLFNVPRVTKYRVGTFISHPSDNQVLAKSITPPFVNIHQSSASLGAINIRGIAVNVFPAIDTAPSNCTRVSQLLV